MENVEIHTFSRNCPTLAIVPDLQELFLWRARFQFGMTGQQLDCDRNTKERQPSTPEQLQGENLLQLSRALKISDLTLDQAIICTTPESSSATLRDTSSFQARSTPSSASSSKLLSSKPTSSARSWSSRPNALSNNFFAEAAIFI